MKSKFQVSKLAFQHFSVNHKFALQRREGGTRRNGNADSRTETYSYDHLGRLTGTSSGRQDTNLEKNLKYDMNGNIVSMSRVIGEEPHRLEFMNTGNHTDGIFDRTSGGHTRYLHDEDGRLVYRADIDPSGNGIRYDFKYNSQGLVEKVTRNDSLLVEYSYLSDGTRTETRMKDGTVFRYRGNFVFRTSPDGKTELESIACDGGRIIPDYRNGKLALMRDIRYLCDDLGNVRTVVDITGGDAPVRVLEENDYMAFGTRFSPSETSPQMADNRYRYNGKESQSFTGLPYIDYGARMYDPYAACWNATDPLASRYFDIGPHVFCADNPINVIDPDGRNPFLIGYAVYYIGAAVITAGVTVYYAYRLSKKETGGEYSSHQANWNPGFDHQRRKDRENQDTLDKQQLEHKQAVNDYLGDPDNLDPNKNPNFNPKKKLGAVLATGGILFDQIPNPIKIEIFVNQSWRDTLKADSVQFGIEQIENNEIEIVRKLDVEYDK